MAKSFDPRQVLRLISNQVLQDLFESSKIELDIPWDKLSETEVEPIFKAWQGLTENQCRTIEILLHEISEMADGEGGIQAIIEEANRQERNDLLEELDGYDSRHDKAAWTAIRASEVWEIAVRFARADFLTHGRYWNKRCDIPAKKPETHARALKRLQEALSSFFVTTQARGRHCKVEHCVRASGLDYFFAYLDDYADIYVAIDHRGAFGRRPERRAFELVIVYDRQLGSLEMFVVGGKKVYEPVQEIFSRVILHEEIGPENRKSHPYELNELLEPTFSFATDPRDGIDSVSVRKLRVSVKGLPRRRITLEADPEGGDGDIYEMLDKYLNRRRLPASIMNVTKAGLRFSFNESHADLPKSTSFEIAYPNSSNLKSKPDRVQELVRKYLREWGLDRAAQAERV